MYISGMAWHEGAFEGENLIFLGDENSGQQAYGRDAMSRTLEYFTDSVYVLCCGVTGMVLVAYSWQAMALFDLMALVDIMGWNSDLRRAQLRYPINTSNAKGTL